MVRNERKEDESHVGVMARRIGGIRSRTLDTLSRVQAFLARAIPDVIDEDGFVGPSDLVAGLQIFGERLGRFVVSPEARETMCVTSGHHHAIEKIQSQLLSFTRDNAGIHDALATLEGIARGIATPRAPAPRPPLAWIELAKDLGVALPDSRPDAWPLLRAQLQSVMQTGASGPANVPWKLFYSAVENDSVADAAKQLRAALVGFGLPAIRIDDAAFFMERSKLVAVLSKPAPWEITSEPPPWMEALGRAIGSPAPTTPPHPRGKEGQIAGAALRTEWRNAIVRRFDATIRAIEKSSGAGNAGAGSLCHLWTVVTREIIATAGTPHPPAAPSALVSACSAIFTGDGDQLSGWLFMRNLGVRLEAAQ
jgi:hypothetical protein